MNISILQLSLMIVATHLFIHKCPYETNLYDYLSNKVTCELLFMLLLQHSDKLCGNGCQTAVPKKLMGTVYFDKSCVQRCAKISTLIRMYCTGIPGATVKVWYAGGSNA